MPGGISSSSSAYPLSFGQNPQALDRTPFQYYDVPLSMQKYERAPSDAPLAKVQGGMTLLRLPR